MPFDVHEFEEVKYEPDEHVNWFQFASIEDKYIGWIDVSLDDVEDRDIACGLARGG